MVERLRQLVDGRTNTAWERLGSHEQETPSAAYGRLRREMIDAERDVFKVARNEGRIPEEVLNRAQRDLDLEESQLQPEMKTDGVMTCDHLKRGRQRRSRRPPTAARTALADGFHDWVHLRLCLTCGHVGCCDSSPRRHATAHYEETGHPVIKSFQPGENWKLVLRRRDAGVIG